MKKTIILIIFLLSEAIFSQAGGLSASKLTALSPTTVPKNSIEFEPAFGFGFSTDLWNENGTLVPIGGNPDTLLSAANFFFRFTYGVADNWEIGISVPSEMSYLSLAGKGEVLVLDRFSAAVLFGGNAPLGNGGYRIYNKGINHFEYNAALVGGGVFSYQFTKNLSLDTDVQLQRHLGISEDGEINRADFFLDSDFGYYFAQGLQAVAGIYYSILITQ